MFLDQQASSQINILVVDADQDFRWVMNNILTASGYGVLEAENAKETLKILEKTIPNLILLNHRIPGETGLQVASKIKKSLPEIPIIMIISYADIKSAVKAMKIGVYDYITKPVDNNDLIFTIKRALEKEELAKEVEHLKKVLKKIVSLGMTILEKFEEREGILTGRPAKTAASFDELLKKMGR